MNSELIRNDFPILKTKVGGHQIVYFDNAATTQRPLPVVNAVLDYTTHENGNPHRGAHIFAISASEAYDTSKEVVRDFIHARSEKEIIYTRNTSESLNLVARSYGETHLKAGDHILITIAEHHSNLVTWQRVAQKTGAILDYIYVDKETGHFPVEELKKIDDPRVKLFAFAEVSNVLGIDFDPKPLIQRAHAHGAIVVLDGAQSTPHKPVDVQDLDCDFFAFSGHKMCSMGGIGVLYGKEELLNDMEPFLMGGDMIEDVHEQETTYAELPAKFEAGTQYVEGAVSLVAAIRYVQAIGFDEIRAQEKRLVTRCLEGMKKLPFIHIMDRRIRKKKKGSSLSKSKASIRMTSHRSSLRKASAFAPDTTAPSRSTSTLASMPPAVPASISTTRKKKWTTSSKNSRMSGKSWGMTTDGTQTALY